MAIARWVIAGAVVAGAAASLAFGQQTDEITAEHTVNPDGTVTICFNVNAERFRGQIFDIDFYRPQPKFGDLVVPDWLPPADTPRERFRGPNAEWRFEPTAPPLAPDGWRALPPSPPVPGEGPYCLTIPHRDKVPPGVAIQMLATDARHLPLKTFASTLRVAANPGGLPRRVSLGESAVAAVGVLTAFGPSCGRPSVIEREFTFAVSGRTVTIRHSGGVASGAIRADGAFRAHGETESYTGAISGKGAIASYDHTESGCTASYEAQFALERAGRVVPACARPTVVAPTRARVARGSRVRLRLGVACAGTRVARWPLEVSLRYGGRRFDVGEFRTTAGLRNVVVRLGGTRPTHLVVRAKRAFGLPAATRRIRLVY